jgi:hypothetical protein
MIQEAQAPVEGGNPTLAARVLDTAGRALGQASVKIWSPPSFGYPASSFRLLDSTVTDSLGNFKLPRPEGMRWAVEIRTRNQAFTREASLIPADLGTITTEPLTSWDGIWSGAGAKPVWVGLANLPLRANVDADGHFRLDSLPPGRHVLVESARQDGTTGTVGGVLGNLLVAGGKAMGPDTVRSQAGTLLVDDFEGQGAGTLLRTWFPASRWVVTPPAGDLARMTPSGNLEAGIDTTRIATGTERRKAWRLQIRPILGNDSVQRGTVGFRLDDVPVDASPLDSVSLWLKGSGTLRVRLVSATGSLQGDLTVDSMWTRRKVIVRDMMLMGNATSPSQVLTRLERIEFTYLDNAQTTLWMDEIRLHGWP